MMLEISARKWGDELQLVHIDDLQNWWAGIRISTDVMQCFLFFVGNLSRYISKQW